MPLTEAKKSASVVRGGGREGLARHGGGPAAMGEPERVRKGNGARGRKGSAGEGWKRGRGDVARGGGKGAQRREGSAEEGREREGGERARAVREDGQARTAGDEGMGGWWWSGARSDGTRRARLTRDVQTPANSVRAVARVVSGMTCAARGGAICCRGGARQRVSCGGTRGRSRRSATDSWSRVRVGRL
ncbi:hypothetical protein PENSPDRAFT_40548 [Peniophora sp. CONT]|nr:hypothetical protein PENSPDRAFT_40548 [Peniophora sp. CONT]